MNRSLLGRTSFRWAAGFVALGILDWTLAHTITPWTVANPALADTYYIVEHVHYALGYGVVLLVFALAYLALESFRRGRRRRQLGMFHLSLTLAGIGLILVPAHLFGLVISPNVLMPPLRELRWLGDLAAAGYVLVLLGQLFFVAVLIDALRREANPR